MKNTDFSLQLLTHKELFATREDAITYFEDNFKPFALVGEPAIAFYGEEKSPKAIVAIGTSTDKRIFFIDVEELSEKIKEVEDAAVNQKDEIEDAIDIVKNIISACGLTFDENKKSNRVSYEPDTKDAVISDAKSLAEAINLISKFVQKGFEENKLNVTDTETVKLTFTDDSNGGKLLNAIVKISNSGDSDDVEFNNNIICKKSDGLYATSNLEYDAEKHQLVFTSSGYKDGKYKDDAYRKTISLEEHSSIDVENHSHNIALSITKIDSTNKYVISGDVVLSENVNNILEIENNALLVKGIANKIQYGNTTLDKELDSINSKIDDANDKIDSITDNLNIEGTTTDTFSTTVRKLSHGFSVNGDVRLSNDGSIKVSDGGLSTNVNVSVDSLTNTLTLTNGTRSKTVTLPGVEIVKNIYYDEANAVLVIELTNSSNPLKIPVADMIETIEVQNDVSSAIELHKNQKDGVTGKSYLYGTLKVRTTDNLLAKDANTGELYVPKSSMTDAIAEETDRAKDVEKILQTNIDANSKAIKDEASRAVAAEIELHKSDDAINTELLSVKNKIETETTARENFDNSIQATVDGHTQSLSDINSSLNKVNTELASETSARELADTKINNSIAANTLAIEKEATRAKEAEEAISTVVTTNENAFETFKNTTNTSVQDLKDADTEIKELITDKVTDINSEIADVKNNMQNIAADLTSEVTRAKDIEGAISSDVATNKKAIADEIKRASEKDTEIDNSLSTHISTFDNFKESTNISIDDLSERIGENTKAIKTETERATAAETELSTKISTKVGAVEIRKNSASDLQYTLYVDEKPCGDINIPSDQFLKSVSYDSTSKKIHFVFKTTDGEIPSDIDVSDLVDTYTAGNGIVLEDNKFTVQISEGSESYLTVTEGGIKLVGINDELAKKANIGSSYTKEESDGKYITEHQSLDSLATKDELAKTKANVDAIDTRVKTNEDAIVVINGNEATEGSIKKAFADAKAYTNSTVAIETERATAKEGELQTEIATKVGEVKIEKDANNELIYILYVDGKKCSEISIPKDQFLKSVNYNAKNKELEFVFVTSDGEKVTNVDVADLVDTYVAGDGISMDEHNIVSVKVSDNSEKYLKVTADGIAISGIESALNAKANTNSVYTKNEADSKFLTEHQSLDAYAKKTEVEGVSTNLATEVTRATAAEKAIEDKVAENYTKSSFTVNKTNTVNLSKTANTDGSSVLEANVEVSSLNGNLIKADQPLYASVDLSYDEGTNTLKFSSSALAETKEIKLSVGSIIDSINYDSANEEIVIAYTNAGGEKGEVRFSVRTLFNQLTVQTDHLGAIILSKVTKDGKDILSGEVVLSSLSTNALVNDMGSLYVSNQAKDYKMADDVTVEKAVTTVKEKVTDLDSRVTEIEKNGQKTSIVVADTSSIKMNMTEDMKITSYVIVDSDENNLLQVKTNGIFVSGDADYGTY